MRKFSLVATGGTFDELHIGHLALLSKAFEVGDKVIIGISSDDFASKVKKKARLNHNYEQRVRNLHNSIEKKFGHKVRYTIAKLDNEFGPTVTEGPVEALVASLDTAHRGHEINRIRQNNNLNPISIIAVNILRAEDGGAISSSRIRTGEIDATGKILRSRGKK
ncbi:MAG TPA: pantetheine-phosphate adenylyltransferase [Nitrososphaeraceae archaeon]